MSGKEWKDEVKDGSQLEVDCMSFVMVNTDTESRTYKNEWENSFCTVHFPTEQKKKNIEQNKHIITSVF